MASKNDEQPTRARLSIPWFGARKMARRLAAELEELRGQHVTVRDQLHKLTTMSRELIAEVERAREERDIASEQLEALGALSNLQLELRRREVEKEIAEQTVRLETQKSEAAAALDSMKRELKKAHEGI